MEDGEDRLFDMLRRVPFDEMLPKFLENINTWSMEQKNAYIHTTGWTINDFNKRWLQDLEP